MAEFESPIVVRDVAVIGPMGIIDESATTKFLVRSESTQFGVDFGASKSLADALVCGTRPGEWLILGTPEACASATADLDGSEFTSVIDHTHARALLRLTGESAPAELELVCDLDWSDDMTPAGAVVSASVAKVNCDIVRDDLGGVRSYLLSYDRSFGQYLYDALTQSDRGQTPKGSDPYFS